MLPLRKIADQRAVRRIHKEGADDDASQQLPPVNQRKRDVIEVGMAGKNIRLPQILCPLSGLHVQQKTLFLLKYLSLQYRTVACCLSKRHQHGAIAVNELNGKAGKFLKIPQYICDSGFRHEGENAGYHLQHLI